MTGQARNSSPEAGDERDESDRPAGDRIEDRVARSGTPPRDDAPARPDETPAERAQRQQDRDLETGAENPG